MKLGDVVVAFIVVRQHGAPSTIGPPGAYTAGLHDALPAGVAPATGDRTLVGVPADRHPDLGLKDRISTTGC